MDENAPKGWICLSFGTRQEGVCEKITTWECETCFLQQSTHTVICWSLSTETKCVKARKCKQEHRVEGKKGKKQQYVEEKVKKYYGSCILALTETKLLKSIPKKMVMEQNFTQKKSNLCVYFNLSLFSVFYFPLYSNRGGENCARLQMRENYSIMNNKNSSSHSGCLSLYFTATITSLSPLGLSQ